jgi:hypothetical protein
LCLVGGFARSFSHRKESLFGKPCRQRPCPEINFIRRGRFLDKLAAKGSAAIIGAKSELGLESRMLHVVPQLLAGEFGDRFWR